jgi:transposase InsO family protein
MKITRVLTDNGKEFTDRLFGLRKRAATGSTSSTALRRPRHRAPPAPPMRPQTNGMVERFNGRIEDVLQSHRFRAARTWSPEGPGARAYALALEEGVADVLRALDRRHLGSGLHTCP